MFPERDKVVEIPMPLNKEAYIRYKIIDGCIASKHKPYPSMFDLIDACEEKLGKEFTVSTIQKDIKAMKEDELLGIKSPIKFSKSQNGYYYTNPDYSFNKIPLNDSDIDALKTVTDMLGNFTGTRVSENFNHAIEKIFSSFKESFPDGNFQRKVIQTDVPPSHKGFEHFELFVRAAKDKIPVCFVHYSYGKRKFNSVIAHPVLLKEFQNHWYVVGYSENHRQLRTFGLDRIYEPILLKRKFKEAAASAQEKYFKHVYGVYPVPGQKKQKIIFRVRPMLGDYLLAHPIHASQMILQHYDFGQLDLSLDLIPSQELINYFLSFSTHLKVLKPQWIQDKIQETHLIALKHEKNI